MKKHFSKRVLSIILAVLMLVTSIPIVASAATEWTQVASSDFTKVSVDGWSNGDGNNNSLSLNNVPTLSEGDVSLSWTAYKWGNAVGTVDAANGLSIGDGFIYLDENSNPIPFDGVNSFKIDLEFGFLSDFAISNTDKYGFLTLDTAKGHETKLYNDSTLFFGQNGNGSAYYQGNQASTASADDRNLSTNNILINGDNTSYHYILEYTSHGRLRAYVTNANHGAMFNIFDVANVSLDPSQIQSIALGDDNWDDYYHNLSFKNITFYTGEYYDAGGIPTDSSRNYYLFAYFTGNADETVHLALSNDAINYEPLNGNEAILNNEAETLPGDSGGGINPPSGHARDPFIFRAQDGSYYVLATDMDSKGGSEWGNNCRLLVWNVNDLTDLDTAKPWSINMFDYWTADSSNRTEDYVWRSWAPEAIWDPEVNSYMLYWSEGYVDENGLSGRTVMYYAYTDDFKTLKTAPKLLVGTFGDAIDGNITYDDVSQQYYLFYKNESDKGIRQATAEHASGPYSANPTNTLIDGDYESTGFEGCQIIKQVQSGDYILMVDYYASNQSTFVLFNSSSLELSSFSNSRIGTANINHCSPRHGSVVRITYDEAKALAEKYGKTTFNMSGVTGENKTVNDYLIARYFNDQDVLDDTSANSNIITNEVGDVTMERNIDGRSAAHFDGNSYLTMPTSELFKDANLKDGVTFSWFGYADSANYSRYFDWSTSQPNQIGNNTDPYSYIFSATNMRVGVNDNGSEAALDLTNPGTGAWHQYQMNITKNYFTFFIDGVLQRTEYKSGAVSAQRTPYNATQLNDEMFNRLVNGNLFFGVSSFSDPNLDGYISDFRIYNKALTPSDIDNSLAALAENPKLADDKELGDTQPGYYDPFEDMDTDGDGANDKTAYTASTSDPREVHETVLDINGGVESHYTYDGLTSDDGGYTISMWYNPGESVSPETIFLIGNTGANGNSNRRYFELQEAGNLWYNWEVDGNASYIDIGNAFGSSSLTPGRWNHIVIQIEPEIDYDIIHVYLDGSLVNTIDTYHILSGQNLQPDRSIHKYFTESHPVYYGTSCGHFQGALSSSYLEEFKIYAGVYDAVDVFRQDALKVALGLMNESADIFKEEMKGISDIDGVYTNMADAYDAYDKVQRYLTAHQYGGVEFDDDKIVDLYKEMLLAIRNMHEYTHPQTVEGLSIGQTNLATAIPAEYTQNLLSNRLDMVTRHELVGGTQNEGNGAIYFSSIVWLYDGENTPKAPINCGLVHQSLAVGNSIYFRNINIKSGEGLEFMDNWHVSKQSYMSRQDWYFDTVAANMSSKAGVTNMTRSAGDLAGANVWTGGSNVIQYTGTPDPDSYLTTITPVFNMEHRREWIGNSGNYSNDIQSIGDIYVINFVPVKEALANDDINTVLSNITEYSPAAARKLLNACDALTDQSYILGSVLEAPELAATLERLVNELLGIDLNEIKDSKIADYGDAASGKGLLGAAAEAAEDINAQETPDLEGNKPSDKFTSSSWKSYKHAYDDVQEYFKSLDPETESDPDAPNESFATEQSQIDQMAQNIETAHEHLVERADYSPVDTDTATDSSYTNTYNVGNGTSYENQNYSWKSWMDFKDAYDVAQSWSDKPEEYRADTEKNLVTYKVNNKYGPYIALDAEGNVVTSDDQIIDSYIFVGEFYEKQNDKNPSQFETGDWVEYNGERVQLNGHRYLPDSVDKTQNSPRQQAIIDAAYNLENSGLSEPADYSAYDDAAELLKYQDVGAFTDTYLNSPDSVYSLISTQGSKDTLYTYSNGVSSGDGVTCTTPVYNGEETAYVNVDGSIFKNFSASNQDSLDDKTSGILTALNQANNSDDDNVRNKFTVQLEVYVDGTKNDSYGLTRTLYYGTPTTLSIGSRANNATCYKIEVNVTGENNGGDAKWVTLPGAQTYNLTVHGDTIVRAYVSSNTEVSKKIVVKNIYGKVSNEINATEASYTTEQLANLLPNNGTVPNYTLSGWTANGKALDGDLVIASYGDDTITVSPVYTPSANTYTINLDGVTQSTTDTHFDTKFVLSSDVDNAYAIAVKIGDEYYVASYNTSNYPFYVVGNADFYTITETDGTYTVNGKTLSVEDKSDKEFIRKLDNKLPFVYSYSFMDNNGDYMTYSAPSYGSSAAITELGTLYIKSNNASATEDNFRFGGTGVGLITAKNPDELSQQYYLGVRNGGEVATRAYVKYSYNDGMNSSNTKVQSVDYGNICINNG